MVGRTMGVFLGRVAWRTRRVSAQSLRRAHLEFRPSVDKCWADLGQRLAEFACMERMLHRVEMDSETRDLLQEAMARPVGTLVATAHLGHWELMAAALVQRGFPVHAIAAESKSVLHRWLEGERRRFGVRTLSCGGGARATLGHLRAGIPVAVFVDLVSRGKRRECQFLGRPAHASLTYERLRRLSNAPGLLVWNTRGGDGRYHIRARKIPDGVASGPWLDRQLEVLVGQVPEQWVWLHDRWRVPS